MKVKSESSVSSLLLQETFFHDLVTYRFLGTQEGTWNIRHCPTSKNRNRVAYSRSWPVLILNVGALWLLAPVFSGNVDDQIVLARSVMPGAPLPSLGAQ